MAKKIAYNLLSFIPKYYTAIVSHSFALYYIRKLVSINCEIYVHLM